MKLKIIESPDHSPYLLRWSLFTIFGWSVKLHVFLRSDDDRANHCHPWRFKTLILWGGYWEHTKEGRFWRKPGYFGGGNENYFHRVELSRYPSDDEDSPNQERPAVTLFMTGPKTSDWGFNCPQGRVDHTEFNRKGGC